MPFGITAEVIPNGTCTIDVMSLSYMIPSISTKCELSSEIREELLKWHWWIGDYFDPCTLYPSQIWTTRFLVVPEIVNNDK